MHVNAMGDVAPVRFTEITKLLLIMRSVLAADVLWHNFIES